MDEHRTMVGARNPSSHSCTAENTGPAATSSADTPGAVTEGRHCRACHPRGRVVDVECTRCGDRPIITGALAEDSTPGSVAYPARL